LSEANFVPCIEEAKIKEGEMRKVQIEGKTILLVKKEGQLFCLLNQCPHQGCSFEKGILNEYTIICPCHGWRFDIRTGKCLGGRETTLPSYECKIKNDKVYIKLQE
jgi:nitrite reductase/ring-hydroxylating ferredoxin subunit